MDIEVKKPEKRRNYPRTHTATGDLETVCEI
jgi:hypothetical protein